MDTIAWNLIDKYFKDNPYNLVAHHLDSYNDFFDKGIFQIFRENNPIRFIEREEQNKQLTAKGDVIEKGRNECFLYLGGKNGTKLYFGKPVIYDSNSNSGEPYPHYMYPNDARLRNMTYGTTIHYDVDVEFVFYEGEEKIEQTITLEKIYLGRFPIMTHSNLCILKGITSQARFNLGECRNDFGGYFIIDGKEKCIVSQEKFADNMLYVRKNKDDNTYSYSCEVRSVSEDSSKPIRYTSAKIVAPDATYSNNQIVIDVPNVRKPVPLFILMRALGVVSDKAIIECCLLDLETNSNMIDLFIPSIHDANKIFTQQTALEYIKTFTKRRTTSAVLEILMNYFLPHVGEDNFLNKAYYVGFMVNKLLRVFMKREKPTDRDNFKFKRVETSGSLIYDLFREYFLIQNRGIFLKIDKEFYYHPGKYRSNFMSLVQDNYKDFFKERIIEDGFKKGFKGNWGADPNTKRIGLVQDVNRLSWFTFISHLRKISLPLDPTSKVAGPHYLHGSQWGIIDPVDTPDGGNVGLHKHMSISTKITNGFSSLPLIKWLRANTPLKLIQECSPKMLATSTKLFINGNWIGIIENPIENVNTLKLFRRNGIIPIYASISFSFETNIVYIYTDGGRLTRPVYYKDSDGKLSYNHGKLRDTILSHQYSWSQVVAGFEQKNTDNFCLRNNVLYNANDLYPGYKTLDRLLDMLQQNKGIVDYIDTSEEEVALIATRPEQIKDNKFYTHSEIDPSLMFGVMGNSIIYPEANQLPRDVFSCGQSKQAVSLYHSNYQLRLDKMGFVLNYGQVPLVKSRYLQYICNEEQSYGVNAIVAIMSYTGYNVEDAILINEGSIKRGLFRTTYFTTYEAREESSKVSGNNVNSFFTNIESKENVSRLKEGFDYSKLDTHGLVKENTEIDDRVVLIGQVTSTTDNKGEYIDNSKTTKKGQLGFVDKSFISEGEEGFRIAKIRVREERLPAIGDKMACALPTQQVLTNDGWVEIKDINITKHKVATLDINGNMCYEYPVNKFEYDHNGKMYYVKNKQVEVVCTLNHKLYIKRREKNKGEKEYELLEAEKVMGKMVRFQKSMKNVYPDVEYMNLGNNIKYKMDDWLQLLGMFIADGSVNNRAVVLSAHKQRKIDFNIDFLTKLGISYYHDSYNGYFAINIGKNKEIYEELKQYSLGALNKYLPEYVWKLSQRQCIILLESLMEGDGHTYADGFSRYGTISPKLANDMCRLAVHCGWSGVIKIASEPGDNKHIITGTIGYNSGKSHEICSKNTYYKISIIRKQNQPYINKKVNDSNEEKLIDYDGKVYCVEMPSSHLYYMRENNLAPSMLIGNSRAGQKGTLGLIIPEEDMPFTADGVRPDLIINPHALPSRMTIGQLVECLLGKACTLYGGYGDCTAYATKGANYETYGHMLTKMGYHNSGNQILYNGFTGAQLFSEIFIGPTYYMRLKHMVKDKINYRATGRRSALTRQTNQGRANDGGLRIGEMERDGIMAHGLSYFLNESYMVRGDEYYMAVCNKTGAIAVYNPERNLFLSPFSDGPLVFNNSKDGQPVLDALSIYGRSFSILRIPYALKLLIQELQVMNVQMRIITEENVDQLLNLSYQSQNIDKLLGIDHGEDGTVNREIREIIENHKKNTMSKIKADNAPVLVKENQYGREMPQNLDQGEEEGVEGVEGEESSPEYAKQFSQRPGPGYDSEGEGLGLGTVKEDKGLDIAGTVNEGVNSLNNSLGEAASSISNTVSGTISDITNKLGSASDALLGENQLEIFDDVQMNAIFNKLSPDKKAAIIKMDEEQRKTVMTQIMAAAQAQKAQSGGGGLSSYFNGLPVQNQIAALQNTYKSMANEFKQLSGVVNAPQITIVKPQSAAEALYGGPLSLFAPLSDVKKGGDATSSDSSDSSKNSSSSDNSSSNNSSSNNDSSSSSGGAIKIIKV